MRRSVAAAILAAVVLAGCADPIVWNKSGATQQDYYADSYVCVRDAKALGGAAYLGFGVTERTTDWNVFGHCMIAHGWRPGREQRP